MSVGVSGTADGRRVLVLAVSARALSESAARAGYVTRAVDAFGDLDQLEHTPTVALSRERGVPWSARAAAVAARGIPCDMVVYGAGFENHPAVVSALGTIAPVTGNAPDVLRLARNPAEVARRLAARGICVPALSETPPPTSRGTRDLSRRRWLRKPRDSGGGTGIANWRAGIPLAPRTLLQERISGVSGSIVFASTRDGVTPLAISTQLVGDTRFGANGYRYCGNILDHVAPQPLYSAAVSLAESATQELGLTGVNGIDFIARDDIPWPVEINPRYSASMELAERAYGISIFDAHVRACRGELPAFDLGAARRGGAVFGKAVLYARRTSRLPDTRSWLADRDVRDVPHPFETVPKGRPICTIFARAENAAACERLLAERAAALYQAVEREGA